MSSYEQALEAVLAGIRPLPSETVALLDSLGHALSEDIAIGHSLPPFDNSAMDGFALRAADIAAASSSVPVRLPVQETVLAGSRLPSSLRNGAATRIMTGAPLPDGADAVVPIEDVTTGDGMVILTAPAPAGQFVRRKGEEYAAGATVLSRGQIMKPAAVGLAAAAGRATVDVIAAPRVAVVVTGDELIEPGRDLPEGCIYNSNGYGVGALIKESGARLAGIVHAGDTRESLREAFDTCRDADVVITTGGVSVGDRDYVKEIVAERGSLDLWRVAIRPGKPFAFGTLEDALFFGLPGNPVSALVTFLLFVRPALGKLGGKTDAAPRFVDAALTEDVSHEPGRRSFFRAVLSEEGGRRAVSLAGAQGSGMLSSLVRANCLVAIPETVSSLPAGSVVQALPLS
jgi:molybdopterin molybdotransferase